MPNPPVLLCDTDALVQVFITREFRPLRRLKDLYGIEPVILPEVENELSVVKNSRFDFDVRKALSNGTLQVFDQSLLGRRFAATGVPAATIGAAWSSIQSLGASYYRHVGRGEAYTHAAAVFLGAPVLSHDLRAVNVLLGVGHRVGTPFLRWLDLLVLFYQVGVLKAEECDRARQILVREKEWVPPEFMHSSFVSGLIHFSPRLVDAVAPAVGAPASSAAAHEASVTVSELV